MEVPRLNSNPFHVALSEVSYVAVAISWKVSMSLSELPLIIRIKLIAIWLAFIGLCWRWPEWLKRVTEWHAWIFRLIQIIIANQAMLIVFTNSNTILSAPKSPSNDGKSLIWILPSVSNFFHVAVARSRYKLVAYHDLISHFAVLTPCRLSKFTLTGPPLSCCH